MNQQGWIVAVLFMLSAGFVKAENSPRLSTWNDKNLAAWWQANPDPATWNSAAADLKLALLNAQERYDLEKVFENDHFRGWLVHTRWLELFDVESASDGELQAFRALSLKMEIPRLFVSSLDARDDAEKALKNLIGIAVGNPESIFHYPELAVAFSVVFDQPFPEAWPHPFTKQNWLMLGNPDPAERFGFMISSIEKKQLLLDPSDLSVRELTFAVDSPVDLNEFIYAQQVKLASPASLAALYPAVKYDFPRAQKGNFMWPHGENYHLFEIGKRGGICADQAFFVSQTAKSKGVPALFFLGQGRSGGHAWVGFLSKRGKWELDVAKYRGEKYPVGVAYDPQTWRRITDSQFRFLIKELVTTGRYELMQLTLQWAAMNRDAPFYRGLLRHARKFMPRYFSTWELEAELLEKETDAEVKEKFWRDWTLNFREETDLRTRGQVALLQLFRDAGDDREAERLEQEIFRENKSERFDLAIKVAAETIFLEMDREHWEDAAKEFDSKLSRFRKDSGGHLFYNLVQPYVERCIAAGKREMAAAAVGELDNFFKPQANSMLDQDIATLRQQVTSVK